MTIVGITGHQHRPGIDWPWVKSAMADALDRLPSVTVAYSSLAVGADQVFARVALRRGIELVAIIPMPEYEECFSPSDLRKFRNLLSKSKVIGLPGANSREQAFYQAGKYVVDHSDILIAVWDEHPASGEGGTDDIVAYARSRHCHITLINPIMQKVNYT